MAPVDAALIRKRLAERYPLVERSVEVAGRLWRVTAVQDQDALLDAVETEHDLHHFPYGMLLWASAIGLARHLAENQELIKGARVLELGAGAGLPGLLSASLGASVLQTDYQKDALNLARINAAENGVDGVERALGDWRHWTIEGRFDIVIGSDVLYERTLHFELQRLFERYRRKGATIVISDPVRPQSMELITRLEKEGWAADLDTRRVYWEGDDKEIVIFTLRP